MEAEKELPPAPLEAGVGESEGMQYAAAPEEAMDQQQLQQQMMMPDQYEDAPPLPEAERGYEGEDAPLGDTDDEDEEYGPQDPVDLIREFGQNPLMEGAQRALVEQLKKTDERISSDLQEKEEALKMVKDEREQIGVDMYSLQQQLARLQMSLETAHNQLNAVAENRVQEEDLVNNERELFTENKAAVQEHQKQLFKNQAELDALNDTIRQIEQYAEELRSEIAITRRATYKAEEAIQTMEKHKDVQDTFLDKLDEQIARLQEQLTLYESQLQAQLRETDSATAMITETSQEMELITFEKKQLLQQWKSSLIGLTRRDEALAAAQNTLQELGMTLKDLDTEIGGLRRDLIKEQARNEMLVNVKDRQESEQAFVDEQVAKVYAEKEALAQRYELLQRSIAQTEEEEKKVDTTTGQLQTQLELLMQNLQVVTREKQKLEEDIIQQRGTQTTVSKAVKNLNKQLGKIVHAIHEAEMEQAGVENEISRLNVDSLNAEAHNQQLHTALDKLAEDLTERERLVEKYELEIRQRNDDIEKKMYRVDRLNKKYKKITEAAAKSGDEDFQGPLEANIKQLGSEVDAINNEIAEMKREWLKAQQELVKLTSDTETELEGNQELKARTAILNERKTRVTKDVQTLSAELRGLQQKNLDLRKDLNKLNDLISRNSKMHEELNNSNYVLEVEFVEELKELESQSSELQSQIQQVKEEKAQVADEIVETERQIMLWEKKIELEKETREALDPTVGQAEIKAMEKEIHRMQIRYDSLKREQERLMGEIERAIYKREDIAVRFSQRERNNKQKRQQASTAAATSGSRTSAGSELKHMTAAGLKKKVGALQKDLRSVAEEIQEYESAIEEKKMATGEMTSALERDTAQYGELEERTNQLQASLNDMLYQKQRQQDSIGARQKLLRKFRSLAAGDLQPIEEVYGLVGSGPDISAKRAELALNVERDLRASLDARTSVVDMIDDMAGRFPHLTEVLQRVKELTRDDPLAPPSQAGSDDDQQQVGGGEQPQDPVASM